MCKKKINLFNVIFISLVYMGIISCSQERLQTKDDLSVIPLPREVLAGKGFLKIHANEFSVGLADSLSALLPLLERDYYHLFAHQIVSGTKKSVTFETDVSMPEESYSLHVSDKIHIKAGSKHALMMGWVSLLQLIDFRDDELYIPECVINDAPVLAYRGLLLDVARKFHSIESVYQQVDLCRWYKINYLQLHLNDDQLFVFPSDAYPILNIPGKFYTKQELRELVQYADLCGVTIIPELDAPGHTQTMREAYPDLFGIPDLAMLDLGNPGVIEACKTIAGEMIAIFSSSPYFHIGGDEVWLGNFEKLPTTKEAVRKRNFASAHDLYLDYIVQMHEFVKSKGKQTLLWESFEGNGSEHVKIPADIQVFAWESMYQRPDSLIKNGYKILNASWKPCYITPQIRWTQQYIYDWNVLRWENFISYMPSFNGIQLDDTVFDKLIGTQMCAWEMTEEMDIPAVSLRLPALSENGWNPAAEKEYGHFRRRFLKTDEKIRRILFPANIEKKGIRFAEQHERFYNRENYFIDEMNVTVNPLVTDLQVRYTTDGTVPTGSSLVYKEPLKIDSTSIIRFGLFQGNKMVGYKSELYDKRPIEVLFAGNLQDLETLIDMTETFESQLAVQIKPLKEGLDIRYTTDGKYPTLESTKWETDLQVSENTRLNIQCFNSRGYKEGSLYRYNLKKNE